MEKENKVFKEETKENVIVKEKKMTVENMNYEEELKKALKKYGDKATVFSNMNCSACG